MKSFLKNKLPYSLIKLYRLFSKKDRVKLLGLLGMMFLAAVLEVAGIGMIPAFVSIVTDPERVMQYEPVEYLFELAGIETSRDLLVWGSVALIGIFVVKNLYLIGFFRVQSRFIFNRRYDISTRLMNAYMQAPYTFHLQRNTAQLLRNVTQEVQILVMQVVSPLMRGLLEGVMALGILVFLLVMEPLITLVVFALLGGGTGLFLYITQKRVKKAGQVEQNQRQGMIKAVNQGIGGIKDARVLNREPHFMDKFQLTARRSSDMMAFRQFVSQIPKPVVETIAVGGMMLIALLMVWQGRPMSTIVPTLTLFAMATVRLMPAIRMITTNMTNVRYGIVCVNPIHDDIQALQGHGNQLLADRKVREGERLPLTHHLEAQNLWYHYPESEERALRGVNFTVPRGSAVAFTGPSGAGKTTIADVLLGLLEPESGTINVDDKNIRNNLSAWQRNIGYIPQFIYLADETLRSNIAFGVPEHEVDETQVWEAVKLAQLEELVAKLPKGLDTVIGERGTRLSGGQRQRVGIARALYHDPQVLVMDEATSALDNLTEKQIIKAIERLKGERTVIMIAHRLTTVENCDTIYFMQEGKIVSSGTYEELLEKNSEFKKLAVG